MNIPPFAVSQFTTFHQSFEQDVVTYSTLGAMMDVAELKMAADPGEARRQARLIDEAGVNISGFVPRVHALFPDTLNPEPHDPAERTRRYKQSIDFVAECWPGKRIPLVAITGSAPQQNLRTAFAIALETYAELAEYAGTRGLPLMLEPLSPLLMNTDTFICTFDRALQFVRQVDHPNFGLAFDTWHVWDEPGIAETTVDAGDRIFGVHVSDWPQQEPRGFADRLIPGEGVMDLPMLMGALDRAGYHGPQVLEIFSDVSLPDSLWLRPADEIIERGRRGMAKAWDDRR